MSRIAAVCMVVMLSAGPAAAQGSGALEAARTPSAEGWVFSEMASPLDYAPVIIASAWSTAGADGSALQLSIQCRRGRTDLVVLSPSLTGKLEDDRLSWSVNGGAAVALAAGPAASGTGLAVKDDVVRLLAALPADGELAIQIIRPQAEPLEGRYALGPLSAVRKRMAEPCKWPATAGAGKPQ
jgi:hypothetical protein